MVFLAVALVGTAVPASAGILEATLIEDTFVKSLEPDSNFDGSTNEIWIRNHNTVSRLGLFQFVLPQLPTGVSSDGVLSVTLEGVPARVSSPSLEVVGVEINPDLTTITYNQAVALDIIDGLDGSYNIVYGANAEGYSQLWSTTGASVGTGMLYTDDTAGDGLLEFIKSHISDAAPVTVTIGIGPTGAVATTDFRFYSMESTVDNAAPMILTLDVIPEPGCTVLYLGIVAGFGFWMFRKRRR